MESIIQLGTFCGSYIHKWTPECYVLGDWKPNCVDDNRFIRRWHWCLLPWIKLHLHTL